MQLKVVNRTLNSQKYRDEIPESDARPSLNSPEDQNMVLQDDIASKSNRKAMNRNWSNQKANPALKTKAGNK